MGAEGARALRSRRRRAPLRLQGFASKQAPRRCVSEGRRQNACHPHDPPSHACRSLGSRASFCCCSGRPRASRRQVPRHRGRCRAVAGLGWRSDGCVGRTRASRSLWPKPWRATWLPATRAARPWLRGSTIFISRQPAAGLGSPADSRNVAEHFDDQRDGGAGSPSLRRFRAIASYYPMSVDTTLVVETTGQSRGACAIVRRLGAKRARALTARGRRKLHRFRRSSL